MNVTLTHHLRVPALTGPTLRTSQLDLFEDEDLQPRIVKQYSDPSALGSTKADFTLNLKLPRTDRNRTALEHPGDLQLDGTSFLQAPQLVELKVDGCPVITGKMLVLKATPRAYECQVVGSQVSFLSLLKGRSIRDTNMPCVYYTGTRGELFETTGEGYDQGQRPQLYGDGVSLWDVWNLSSENDYGFCMPLVCLGNQTTACPPDGSDPRTLLENPVDPFNRSIEASNGFVGGSAFSNYKEWPMNLTDFAPAVFLRPLVRQMLLDVGIEPSGTFFTDPNFDRVCLLPGEGSWDAWAKTPVNRGYLWRRGLAVNYRAHFRPETVITTFVANAEYENLQVGSIFEGVVGRYGYFDAQPAVSIDLFRGLELLGTDQVRSGPPQGSFPTNVGGWRRYDDQGAVMRMDQAQFLRIDNLLAACYALPNDFDGDHCLWRGGPLDWRDNEGDGPANLVRARRTESQFTPKHDPDPALADSVCLQAPWTGSYVIRLKMSGQVRRRHTEVVTLEWSDSGDPAPDPTRPYDPRPRLLLYRNADPDSLTNLIDTSAFSQPTYTSTEGILKEIVLSTQTSYYQTHTESEYDASTYNAVYPLAKYKTWTVNTVEGSAPFDIDETVTVDLEAGDRISLLMVNTMVVTPTQQTSDSAADHGYDYVELAVTEMKVTIEGADTSCLRPATFLDDVDQLDFVKSVLEYFNLQYSVDDQAASINVEQPGAFYYPAEADLDLTDRCDLDEADVSRNEWYRRVYLRHSPTDDPSFEPQLYDWTWDAGSDYFAEERTVESRFAATGTRRLLCAFQGADVNAVDDSLFVEVPTLGSPSDYAVRLGEAAGSDFSSSFGLRLLRWNGVVPSLRQHPELDPDPSCALWVEQRDYKESFYDFLGALTPAGLFPLPWASFTGFDWPTVTIEATASGIAATVSTGTYATDFNATGFSPVAEGPRVYTVTAPRTQVLNANTQAVSYTFWVFASPYTDNVVEASAGPPFPPVFAHLGTCTVPPGFDPVTSPITDVAFTHVLRESVGLDFTTIGPRYAAPAFDAANAAEIVEVGVSLSPETVTSLDLRRQVRVDGRRFRLAEIASYDPTSLEQTRVRMINR